MNIGEAAEKAGLPAKTLRYYEEIGLVSPARSGNGYRDYSADLVRELVFLRRARQFGFSIDDCAQLLALFRDPHRESHEVHELAAQKLLEMNRHIHELVEMRNQLQLLVQDCPNDRGADCAIIDSLAEEAGRE